MTNQDPNPAPKSYSTRPDPTFGPGVAKLAWQPWLEESTGTRIGWMAPGTCPTCGDVLCLYERTTRAVQALTVVAVCNCEGDHPGRPQGITYGCGQQAPIPFDPPADSGTDGEHDA